MYNDYQSSTQDSFQYSNNSRGSSRYIPNTYYNVNSSLNTYPVNQQYLYNNTHIVQSAIQPVIQPKTPPKTLSKTELHIDYTSSWFETENGLSIHDYLRLLFTISHKHFASNCEKDTIKGIIVPHAGLRYSGLCAATAYYALRHRKKHIKRIILFCTNHSESDIFTTSAKTVNSFTGVSTSIGSIPIEIDTKIMHKLEPYTTVNNDIFEKEHSFFMQLPFIEAITPKVKLIPLIIGPIIFNKANIARIYKIFNILIDLLQDEKTVIICTSDLSHVNGHFPTKVNSYIYHSIRSKDSETLKFIYNKLNGTKGKRNMDIIQDISELNNSASCGIVAMYLFAKLLNLFSSKYIKRSSVSSSSNGSNGSKSSNGSNGSNGSKSSNSSNRSSRSSKSSRSKSTSTSTSTSFDSTDSNESINNNKNTNNKNTNTTNTTSKPRLFTRTLCYYTSLQREQIDLINFTPFQLVKTIDISNISQSSVSYVSIAITTQPYISNQKLRKLDTLMSNFENLALLTLAREQLFNTLISSNDNLYNNYKKSKIPTVLLSPIYSQVFQCNLGVFVTIYKNNGALRGCIGTTNVSKDIVDIEDIENIPTIESNVSKYVQESAMHDSRFKPLDISEYNSINLSITILNSLKQITINQYFGDRFVLGRDGILVKNNKASGFFLPSVAKEFNYDKKALIEALCADKMGQHRDCYIDNAMLYYNEGYEISEKLIK